MSARSDSSSSKRDFRGLSGRELIEHALGSGWTDVVEAFWRYGDPQIAAQVAECVLRNGNPVLAQLIVEEIVAPTVDEPLPTTIMGTLAEDRPRLSERLTNTLGTRLLDEQPFVQVAYESGRGLLERWVMEQKSPIADQIALAAVRQESPTAASDPSVRNSAYERCATEPRLLKTAADVILERAQGSPSATAWQEAATFLELACADTPSLPAPLKPVLDWLIENAPSVAQEAAFPDALAELVARAGASKLDEIVGGDAMPATPRSGALLRVIERVGPARTRVAIYAAAAAKQPQLWNVLSEGMAGWDDAEWKRRLAALGAREPLDRQVVMALVPAAPAVRSVEVVDFALRQSMGGPGDQLLQQAALHLRGRLDSLAGDDEVDATAAHVDAIRWPRRGDSPERRELLKAVLDAAWSSAELGTEIVLAAREGNRITLTDVAYLLPDDQVESALDALQRSTEREQLVRELSNVRMEELLPAVSSLQGRGLALDLACALAEVEPDVAFTGGAESWDGMSNADKDELTSLLADHGRAEQVPVLETIVSDVHRNNAKRRAQATAAIAELTPEGGTLPACVVELLTSARPELRRAGVQAIGKVRPRDESLIRHLREIASGGGQLGREATQVLDELGSIFTSELDQASSLGEVSALLPLLGAVGRPTVIDPLLGYVGPEAEYDDKDIHRLAAAALRSACESVRGDVTSEQQAALVGLLEGEGQEVDREARDDLSAALASVALGEDAALAILYEEIGFDPGIAPSTLYGEEKDSIVRHTGLWSKERDRGKAGRPGQLENLDIICERLIRAAYLKVGGSENIKAQIRADETKPDYGALITALGSTKLAKQEANLQTLHDLRCNHTFAHIGSDASDADMVRAGESFKEAAKAIIGTLKGAALAE